MNIFSTPKYTSFSVVFLSLFVLNQYNFESPVLGVVLCFAFFIYFGSALGWAILPRETFLHRSWAGGLLLGSIIMILGSAFYYLFVITPDIWTLLVLLTPPLVFLAYRHRHRTHDTLRSWHHHVPTSTITLIIVALLALVIAFAIISEAQIFDAIRTPWEQIPTVVFIPIFTALLSLTTLLLRGRERAFTLPLIMAVLFLVVSVAALVYPIGYGFDTFIHRATETHIALEGSITPKPFYYIGQYSLVLFSSQAFHLPLESVDRILLPLLVAILLPLAWYFAFYHLTANRRASMFSLMALFFVPLSGFIVTTPQGLANLWTLLIILLSIPILKDSREVSLVSLFVIGVAGLLIHPLAGIPIMLYLALIASGPKAKESRWPGFSNLIFWLLAITGSIVLPLVFIINAKISGLKLNFDWSLLAPTNILDSLNLSYFVENRFSTLLDFVYLYGFNTSLILILLSISGWFIYRRQLARSYLLPAAMILILFINYVVMRSAIDFSFLIDYERTNYADRLVPMMMFFAVPFLGLAFVALWQHLQKKPIVLQASALVLIAAFATSAFYLTYPRTDNYVTSHGFNVGQADINAVYSVDESAAGQDYIVLANQSVSAAAINEFGFKKYYGEYFFYPVPTGGTMYEHFLNMNDEPTHEKAVTAMDLADVDWLYYVVNEYWWQAPRIIETAKRNAHAWSSIDAGKVYIFEYRR